MRSCKQAAGPPCTARAQRAFVVLQAALAFDQWHAMRHVL